MKAAHTYSIAELIPHRGSMLLLDALVSWDDHNAVVSVDPLHSTSFADAQGNIPAWVGIEYMAQAIAAFAGVTAKQHQQPIKLGFLLGTRRYHATVTQFSPGQQLMVSVRQLLHDENNLVLFDCYIHAGDQLLAHGEIKAIQPDNVDMLRAQFDQMIKAAEE